MRTVGHGGVSLETKGKGRMGDIPKTDLVSGWLS